MSINELTVRARQLRNAIEFYSQNSKGKGETEAEIKHRQCLADAEALMREVQHNIRRALCIEADHAEIFR